MGDGIINWDLISAPGRERRLREEVERLNTALDNMRAEYMANLNRLEPEVKRLRALLHEVAVSGVAFEDPRISYVEVQINRDDWVELQEGLPWLT